MGQQTTDYQTGDRCPTDGSYMWQGYVDGSASPAPTPDETHVSLSQGDTFPPVASSGKASFWSEVDSDRLAIPNAG